MRHSTGSHCAIGTPKRSREHRVQATECSGQWNSRDKKTQKKKMRQRPVRCYIDHSVSLCISMLFVPLYAARILCSWLWSATDPQFLFAGRKAPFSSFTFRLVEWLVTTRSDGRSLLLFPARADLGGAIARCAAASRRHSHTAAPARRERRAIHRNRPARAAAAALQAQMS